ncbi:dihydrolipoyl dehydrogenase [Candidatus Neomarinimicrobiota bacterium]
MPDKIIETEVVVIGAGPGGYAAAFRASDLGRQVVMIDKAKELGGVCLNRGCIPSKALLHIAKVIEETRALSEMGVKYTKPKLDLDKIRGWKDKVVSQLNGGISQMAKARKVEAIQGEAKFVTGNELSVVTPDGVQQILFKSAIVATGSRPAKIPGFPYDHSSLLDSTSALELESIPERLLIIGGGYIGLEMGTVYRALGSKVNVVEMLDTILPGADQDLIRLLLRNLKQQFEEILVKSKVTKIIPKPEGSLSVQIESDGKTTEKTFDKVLVAVGRKPNTENLGLENAGLTVNNRGLIEVDKYQRTGVSNIYAIGDITGDPMLAHKATHEGKVAAEIIAGLPAAFDTDAIPAVMFTDPEVAWVGLTETEAKMQNIPYEKGEFPWAASGRALSIGQQIGKTKILFDPETKRVLGVGIIGSNAGDLISEGTLAIEMGADVEDLSLTIHPHPTLSETVGNAAEVFAGTVTDLYMPKRRK